MRIFDPNFMRTWRKPAYPRGKILNGERVLRGDEILSGGGILSDRALNVGKISSGSGILNLTSRGGIRRGFCRWILRELRGEASRLRLRHKFQSANGSQTDYKFKRAVALQTDRKFKMAASLRTDRKFKTSMQKFHRGFCAAAEIFRQKLRSETVPHNRLKFQCPPHVLARSKFGGAMSEIGTGSPSVPLKFQISVAALLQLKFQSMLSTIALIKFQSAAAEFARFKFQSLSRAAQCRKIREQGQGG